MNDGVAISSDSTVEYPRGDQLSPPELYPEYPFRNAGAAALSPSNRVYPLVRRVLRESGADAEHFGTPQWNPLGQWISKGQRVFVLANFVKDRRRDESANDFASKCTHASVLRAVLDYATIATGDPARVAFGNAPIQSCDYERVTEQTGADHVRAFYAAHGNPSVGPHDLRLVVSKFRFGAMVDKQRVNAGDGVSVDLGAHSLLESHYAAGRPVDFRVGDYPGSETMAYHSRGRHVYVVNRRVLDADVIISVPKLKTHARVGVTCALKGTVGAIGSKECLAHHRLGAPARGGDEYPTGTWLRDFASLVTDKADSGGVTLRANAFRIASKVLNRSLRAGPKGIMLGMWHGNDTCWRMSLDIARLLRFADREGKLSSLPVRRHLAFVDGIVGGEGEGPLRSTARRSGLVVFGTDVALVDAACALVMGFEPRRVPLIAGAFGVNSFPITEAALTALRLTVDGRSCEPGELSSRFGPGYAAPKGWRGRVEVTPARRTA